MNTFELYGQPMFKLSALEESAVSYELMFRRHIREQFLVPEEPSDLLAERLEQALDNAIRIIPNNIHALSVNLTRGQFVDYKIQTILKNIQRKISVRLIVELAESPSSQVKNTEVINAAKMFFNTGIAIFMDDVASGDQLPGLVEALTPYLSGYKFSLLNMNNFMKNADLLDRFNFWKDKAEVNHKQLDVSGVETLDDILYLKERSACELIQGSYFGAPILLEY